MATDLSESILEDIRTAIEEGEITDESDFESFLCDRLEGEFTYHAEALDYLKETDNLDAYFDEFGRLEKNPMWPSMMATSSLRQDVMDQITSISDLIEEHRPGDRCEGCGDRIDDEDLKVTTEDGSIYETSCVPPDARCLRCPGCTDSIADNHYFATEYDGIWYCDDCVPEDDEEDGIPPESGTEMTITRQVNITLPDGSTMTDGTVDTSPTQRCAVCNQVIDMLLKHTYRPSRLGGYVHVGGCPG